MQVSVEALEGLSRKMRVAVPSDDFQQAYQQSVRQLSRTVSMKGFRKGKVPVRIVEQQYGGQARQDALSQVLQKTYPEALKQIDLQPAGQPEISFDSLEGEEIVYTATFDVFPDITLTGLDGLALETASVEVGDADVDRVIEGLLEQRQTWPESTEAAQDGDRVTLDFKGTIDGEEFAGGAGEDTTIVLGAGRFLKELEDGIVGMRAGEQRDVPVTFPADYHNDDLKGKAASFAVNLKKVESPEKPELDEEFVKSLGVEEGGLDELKSRIRDNLTQERDKLQAQWRKSQILEGVLKANPIDVPGALVTEETGRLRQETARNMNMSGRGLSEEQLEQMIPDAALEPQAKQRAALGLLLSEIIKQEKLSVSDDKVEERLQQMAGDYEDSDAALSYYRGNQQFMQGLRAVVLEDQIVDMLAEKAKTTEVSLSFEELTQKVRG
nr:trigger factor [Oceanococcus sp. HetDA_MAG_MS8]